MCPQVWRLHSAAHAPQRSGVHGAATRSGRMQAERAHWSGDERLRQPYSQQHKFLVRHGVSHAQHAAQPFLYPTTCRWRPCNVLCGRHCPMTPTPCGNTSACKLQVPVPHL